ncbi:MAG: hypothetical protein P4L33_07245 [Capsulimonadaceae bacterium]|nr:hypothetical protein [Capsulimonadaceae bacterium]
MHKRLLLLCFLGVVCAGTVATDAATIAFWPYAPVPADAMRAVVLPVRESAAFEAAFETKGELGLPNLWNDRRIAWRRLTSLGDNKYRIADRARLDDRNMVVVIAGHFFSPVLYREQDYRFRLTCNKASTLFIDGQNVMKIGAGQSRTVAVLPSDYRIGPVRFAIVTSGSSDTEFSLSMAQPGDVHFFADLPPILDKSVHVTDYPSVAISNGIIYARLAIPDPIRGYYRANRFEQAGMILSLVCKGHTYLSTAPAVHNPLDVNLPIGLCEECFDAIAWDDAKPGEPFIKFGVGLYEKQCIARSGFSNPAWPIQLFGWTTHSGNNWVEFSQEIQGSRGWSYRYVKRIVLVPGEPVMRIEHELVNTGSHEIDIEQYNHNWVNIDGNVPSDGYSVQFPFTPMPTGPLSPCLHLSGNTISTASSETVQAMVAGFDSAASDKAVRISTMGSPASLEINCDTPLSKVAVYMCPKSICYEPFVCLHVPPGESTTWSRTYRFISAT